MVANSVTIITAIPDELEKHVEHSTADAEDVNLTIVTPTAVTIEHVQEVSFFDNKYLRNQKSIIFTRLF